MPRAKGSLKDTEGKILPPEIILTYVKQIVEALQYAHSREIVHRDIKPGNFLIGSRDEILLSDFGIATITNSVRINAQEFAGSPHYMPPEQWRNQAVRASDQYALAVCVYQWLCGDVPFRGTMEQLLWAHMQQTPLSFKEKGVDVPPEVEQAIMKALSKEPHNRFASIQLFASTLEHAFRSSISPVKNTLSSDCKQLVEDWMSIIRNKWLEVSDRQLGWRAFLSLRWNNWDGVFEDTYPPLTHRPLITRLSGKDENINRQFEVAKDKGSAASAVVCFLRDMRALQDALDTLELKEEEENGS